MRDVKLLYSVVENLLSIRHAVINFENRGLVLIEGPNGVGKSALVVEPLCFGLFGQSERYGKSRDLLINRFVGKDLHVGVSLMLDDNRIEVDAYRKHHRYKDEVFLKVNGKDQRGNSNDQTWDKIVKLLDMDYVAFTNSVVFGQALSQYFSGLSDSAQKEIVERLLSITWIPKAYEVAKEDRDECQNFIYSAESEISILSKNLESKSALLEEYKNKYEAFEGEKINQIKELERMLVRKVDVSELEKNVGFLKQEKEEVENTLEDVKYDISELDKVLVRRETEVKGFKQDLSKIEAKLRSTALSQVGSICEFCGNEITEETIEKYGIHLLLDRSKLIHALAILLSEIDSLVEDSKNKWVDRDKLAEAGKKLNFSIALEEDKLNKLNLSNAKVEESNRQIRIKMQELENSKNTYSDLVSKFEKEVEEEGKSRIVRVEGLSELRSEIDYHNFWVEGFSNKGLKSFIMESAMPQMNKLSRLYSTALGGKFNISFAAQKSLKKGELRDKFYVDVLNKKGAQSYDGNSNGERRVIDSIVMFVLGDLAASRSNKRFSVLILDDVFEKLDEDICDSIIRVLQTMTSNDTEGLPRRESIFVLTHLEYFKSKFNNRMIVGRENGDQTIYREG
jgi:DNA repair exonuclease SbcCD ATPase subunit